MIEKKEEFHEESRAVGESSYINVNGKGNDISEPVVINERKLLFKIDVFVLSFVCLQFWINYVDRIGFTNAYISGMKESLHMKGDEFNITTTCFTVGYIIGMIPNNLILLVVSPRIWLSFCTFAWGFMTLSLYHVTTFRHCCAIRFFQALFESCTFTGTQLILGSWYKESELPIRTSIFTSSGLVGSMFSGFMQSSIFHHLDGKCNLEGWRWLFIIDFCVTMPIVIYGFIFFPGMPESHQNNNDTATNASNVGKSRWSTWLDKVSMARFVFSEQELQYARRRLPVRDETTTLDWSVAARTLKRWHWWLFSLIWVLGGENISFASNSTFALWLENQGYTLTQRNNYPSGIFAVGIVATVGSAVYLSKVPRARHWHVSIFMSVVMVIVAIMIRVSPLDPKVVFTAQYLGGVCYAGQSVFFAWANVVCYDDLQERAIVLASMNMFSGAVNAWWSLLFYAAQMVPGFVRGCYAMIGTAVSSAILSVIIRILEVKERNKKKDLPYMNANDMLCDDDILVEEDDDDDDEEEEEEGDDRYSGVARSDGGTYFGSKSNSPGFKLEQTSVRDLHVGKSSYLGS